MCARKRHRRCRPLPLQLVMEREPSSRWLPGFNARDCSSITTDQAHNTYTRVLPCQIQASSVDLAAGQRRPQRPQRPGGVCVAWPKLLAAQPQRGQRVQLAKHRHVSIAARGR